ncbi:MAG: SPOR domain-containing protein [Deltaproteobacteria bacterium]|nr:SPOR domain-containing protein [Deltaproteobacteria bacterium]
MAERRYGFRFSFVEGCVIVASIVSASFLVFLFGVYAGREMEARKVAESARISRVVDAPVESSFPARSEEGTRSAPKEKPTTRGNSQMLSPPSGTESKTPVLAFTPPRPESSLAIPPAVPEENLPPSPQTDESVVRKEPQKGLITGDREAPQQRPAQSEAASQKPPMELAKTDSRAVPAAPVVRNLESASPFVPSPPVIATPKKPEAVTEKLQKTANEKEAATAGRRWSVQVYASQTEGEAKRLADQLRGQGHSPVVSKVERNGETWYRVRIGVFASADEARHSVEQFRREGKFRQAYPTSN